jgi:hypothetical protein
MNRVVQAMLIMASKIMHDPLILYKLFRVKAWEEVLEVS